MDKDEKIINIIKTEVSNWYEGECWATDKVAFVMRNIILKARKNFFGIYDEPTDPITGRKKHWVPLTESTVESVLKNIDIDTRDITVVAHNRVSYKKAKFVRNILSSYFEKIKLDRLINDILRRAVIDGTAFVKTWKEGNELKQRVVDVLNILVDPSAETIEDSASIIERHILTIDEFKSYEDWDNTEEVTGEKLYNRTGIDGLEVGNQSEIPYVEVYERYGLLPAELLGGKEGDWEYGVAVVSGLKKNPKIHQIKKVKEHPYVAFFYKKVPNRFHGRGIPEMLFNLQAYLNETSNSRLNVARIAQTNLWEARGSITPQQIRNLFQTGVIKYSDAKSSIRRLETGTVDASSYKDEETASAWSQRVTQTTIEDEIEANKPATNAMIEERGASKAYRLVMEGLEISMEELIHKMLPIIKKLLGKGTIVRMSGDPEELRELTLDAARTLVYNRFFARKGAIPPEFNRLVAQGVPVDQVLEITAKQLAAQLDTDDSRFVEAYGELLDDEFGINIVVGDAEMNKGMVAQTLVSIMPMMAQAGLPIKDELRRLFDVLGLPADEMVKDMPQQAPMTPGAVPVQGQLPAGQVAEAQL